MRIDRIGMIVITVPLLSPILQSYGIDLVWFGVLLVVLIELGQITPPMGLNLFVVKSVSSSSLGTIIKGSLPFCAMIYVLILVLARSEEHPSELQSLMRISYAVFC